MKRRRSFDPVYERRRRPPMPAKLQKNVIKRWLGIASPSLCSLVDDGGYHLEMLRYLCYRRRLTRRMWYDLHREVRIREKEEKINSFWGGDSDSN